MDSFSMLHHITWYGLFTYMTKKQFYLYPVNTELDFTHKKPWTKVHYRFRFRYIWDVKGWCFRDKSCNCEREQENIAWQQDTNNWTNCYCLLCETSMTCMPNQKVSCNPIIHEILHSQVQCIWFNINIV
jgi:hypothetical protein